MKYRGYLHEAVADTVAVVDRMHWLTGEDLIGFDGCRFLKVDHLVTVLEADCTGNFEDNRLNYWQGVRIVVGSLQKRVANQTYFQHSFEEAKCWLGHLFAVEAEQVVTLGVGCEETRTGVVDCEDLESALVFEPVELVAECSAVAAVVVIGFG